MPSSIAVSGDDVKCLEQTAKLEQASRGAIGHDQREGYPAPLRSLGARQEQGGGGGVHEVERAQIDDDLVQAGPEQPVDGSLQRFARGYVQLSAGLQHRAVVLVADGDVKHRRMGSGNVSRRGRATMRTL
jgi:hypothetical protein